MNHMSTTKQSDRMIEKLNDKSFAEKFFAVSFLFSVEELIYDYCKLKGLDLELSLNNIGLTLDDISSDNVERLTLNQLISIGIELGFIFNMSVKSLESTIKQRKSELTKTDKSHEKTFVSSKLVYRGESSPLFANNMMQKV